MAGCNSETRAANVSKLEEKTLHECGSASLYCTLICNDANTLLYISLTNLLKQWCAETQYRTQNMKACLEIIQSVPSVFSKLREVNDVQLKDMASGDPRAPDFQSMAFFTVSLPKG